MTSRTRLLVVLVSAPVIVFVVIGGLLGQTVTRSDTYRHLRVFEDVMSLVLGNYVEEVEANRLMIGAMRGLADALDGDSAFLPPDLVRQIERGDIAPPADVGVVLTRQYYLRIVAARDGSPAARAGLRPGDFIRAINSRPTREMSAIEGARLLAGQPGTTVSLMVFRGNAADPHGIDLVREPLVAPDVTGRIAGPGTGYIRIAAFGPRVAEALRAQVAALVRERAARLVIDVRGTAAGDIKAGLAAARLFVPSGTLAIHESKGPVRRPITAGNGDGSLTQPAVVLVNAGTSGPAEIFAAALGGTRRAELVGDRTSGRAAEQTLVRLPDGSGLWLSTGWYLTPDGAVIHEKGLVPDIQVEEPDVEFGAQSPPSDPILEKGLERVKGRG
ncbi:MAG: PDZ domain-containing protein [Acidobacteria bacterium]|nr:PDZ domain-containing protein [Acidobacteriota bacterium]